MSSTVPQRLRLQLDRGTVLEAALVAAAVIAAIAVRWMYLAQFSETAIGAVAVGPDVREYDAWAREILAGQRLWTKLHFHAPLYPYVLAFFYRVSGMHVCGARALQLGLDIIALLMSTCAARLLVGRRAGVVVAVLWAFYLPLVYHSAELISEGLLVTLFSGVFLVWAITRRTERRRMRVALFLAMGLLLGLAAIAHPLSLLFSAVLVPALVFAVAPGSRRQAAGLGAAMVLGIAIPILPVTVRNAMVSGEFVLIQSRAGMNFYLGNNPSATGTCYARPGKGYEQILQLTEQRGPLTERQKARFYTRRALTFILDQPGRWLRLVGRKALLTWHSSEIASGPDLPELQVQTAVMRAPLLRFGAVAPLALAGLWFGRRRRALAPLYACVGAYTAALALFVTSGRYRLGMIPAVLLLSAVGVDGFVRTWVDDDARAMLKGGLCVVLGAVLCFVPHAPHLPDSQAESWGLVAEAAWRGGAPGLAGKCLGAGLAADPENAHMNHLLGVVLTETQRPADALVFFGRAAETAPGNARVRVDWGIALAQLGRRDEAASELARALAIDPDCSSAHYNLGVLAQAQGQIAAAVEHYTRALAVEPALVSAQLNLGVCRHRGGEYDAALAHYATATNLAPRKAGAWACKAALHADRDEHAEARRCFERALRLDQRQPQVWIAYSRALRAAGNDREAEAVLGRGRKANPTDTILQKEPDR